MADDIGGGLAVLAVAVGLYAAGWLAYCAAAAALWEHQRNKGDQQ